MMKKQVILGLSLAAVLLLTACGSPENNNASSGDNTPSESSENASSVANSSLESETATVFTGIIQEDARAGSDDTFQLFLKDVAAVEDEDQVVQSFQNDGVILHVPIEAYSGEIEELVEGDKVQVSLQGVPIMTMSIPPQIPGNSIQKVELVND